MTHRSEADALPGVDSPDLVNFTLGEPGTAPQFEPVSYGDEGTVVAVYESEPVGDDAYESEAALESAFIAQLRAQQYGYLPITTSRDLEDNLRAQLATLNVSMLGPGGFTDDEWRRFFGQSIANPNDTVLSKTKRIQKEHQQVLKREDGSEVNLVLIDKANIHNNRLQVVNQYTPSDGGGGGAKRSHRYDVTILVNGLPLVHVELKRRGEPLRQAFHQISRYKRESFWADAGLFEYVQLFVISNGTHTKYYANTTRQRAVSEAGAAKRGRGKAQSSNSYQFTSWWTDSKNNRIADLTDFTKTFLSQRSLLNVLTRFCVLDVTDTLLVMRPYQIVAAEQILHRIKVASHQGRAGTIDGGGYIWHSTGTGKTLTSFKTARLASDLDLSGSAAGDIDKVLFVVDRKDLDFQTILEYERFEKGAVDGTDSARHLRERLENAESRVIVTTIQKLANFIKKNPDHPALGKHVVLIFDECHRSQFGDMGSTIRKAFTNYHLFGFTGTPIFPENVGAARTTTEQTFGTRLHSYTIVDAIRDGNVLPFKVEYHKTVEVSPDVVDAKVAAIDTEEILLADERVSMVVKHVLDTYNSKTMRTTEQGRKRRFNGMFAVQSIDAIKKYYLEFQRQQQGVANPLRVATIFSYSANEEVDDFLDDESLDETDLDRLDGSSRDFLESAIADYNRMFGTHFDTSAKGFAGYYADLSSRVKKRDKNGKKDVDLVIVVNMFLTGFDATHLNTLWVDKKLRLHGLLQAFSRTNRILDSIKTFGNIVCFRNLDKQVDDAIALFGNKEARGIILLRPYAEYFAEYAKEVAVLQTRFSKPTDIVGEQAEKDFITSFGRVLRLMNVLKTFDDFEGAALLTDRQMQDYLSVYQDLAEQHRSTERQEKESVLDDVVFEMELIKQIDINIDYILGLVAEWRANKGDDLSKDGPSLEGIERTIDASASLRSKKDLIMDFIRNQQGAPGVVGEAWSHYLQEQREAELTALIEDERLKPEPTRQLIEGAFRDGEMSTLGTAVTDLLPPTRRFGGRADSTETLTRVTEKLRAYFERFHTI
jgi:type I restriction enzyme, R subunit